MKATIKLGILILALVIMAVPAVACKESASPAQTQPAPAPKKITLADASMVLDLSPLLPANFEYLDAAREGLSNKDLGLGPDFSEVELFLSEEPYQVIYCFFSIIEGRIQQAGSDALMKDEQQIKSIIAKNLKAGAAKENIELEMVEMRVTYPNVGDVAVLGEGHISFYGASIGFDLLLFRSNKIYVDIETLYLSTERQSLLPLAREIEYRISMFSQ